MDNHIALGMNRTGVEMAPQAKDDMIGYAQAEAARGPESDGSFEAVHMAYIEDAERVGSVPVPGAGKPKAKAGASGARLDGGRPGMLIDKLGERLAFERAGTRLYEAMLLKCGAVDAASNPVEVPQLAHIRDEEEQHFHVVRRALEKLGADATAMTPCADLAGVQGMGLMQVVTDPRTSIGQALNALLTAELADNAGWELLIELASAAGHEDLAKDFEEALQQESEHLAMVRGWLRAAVLEAST